MFCEQCQDFWKGAISKAQTPETITSCEDIRWAPHEVILHSSMRELKRASELQCTICRCILFTPTVWEKEGLLADDDEKINIVLDIDPSKGKHPALSAAFMEVNNEGGEVKARIPKRLLAACGGLLTDEEFSTTVNRTTKLENRSTGSGAALELASFWLKRCVSTHDKCSVPESSDGPNFIPTRVLDVANNHIQLIETANEIQGDMDRRFVALSHCWGKIPIIRTLKANYEEHKKGIDPVALSKTFREAVHVTRKLGFRYIWIDSLCIKQDDSDDWGAEATTMCDVYRFASLTIVAAHAPGGDVGCFEDRDGILSFPFIVDIPTPGKTESTQILFNSYGRATNLGRPEPPLYGRAWVLQEQLLSPRMLIFDGNQLKWECPCMSGSERSPMGGGSSRHVGHHAVIRTAVMEDKEFFENPTFDDPEFAQRIQHQTWLYAIMDFTHRGMTQPSDRLVAIAGIAQALSQKTKHEYIAGLWKEDLWTGLLWSITHQPMEFTGTTTNAFDVTENPHVRHKEPLAPSWSWASVTVPVVYAGPMITSSGRMCEILSSSASGTPARQTGRVEIRGHVRTGYVNSIYPHAIQEAVKTIPEMSYEVELGSQDLFNHHGRSFAPADFFIFSSTKPSPSAMKKMKLVRGTWRPDQVLDPQTEITWIAIAQQNLGTTKGKLVSHNLETDPLTVFTLGLVPTGRVEGEYTRVGYGVWEDCAWYGYMCGHKERLGRPLQKPEGWRGIVMGEVEYHTIASPKGLHEHKYVSGELPNFEGYHKATGVREMVLTIV